MSSYQCIAEWLQTDWSAGPPRPGYRATGTRKGSTWLPASEPKGRHFSPRTTRWQQQSTSSSTAPCARPGWTSAPQPLGAPHTPRWCVSSLNVTKPSSGLRCVCVCGGGLGVVRVLFLPHRGTACFLSWREKEVVLGRRRGQGLYSYSPLCPCCSSLARHSVSLVLWAVPVLTYDSRQQRKAHSPHLWGPGGIRGSCGERAIENWLTPLCPRGWSRETVPGQRSVWRPYSPAGAVPSPGCSAPVLTEELLVLGGARSWAWPLGLLSGSGDNGTMRDTGVNGLRKRKRLLGLEERLGERDPQMAGVGSQGAAVVGSWCGRCLWQRPSRNKMATQMV